MERIIEIPNGIEVEINNFKINIKGPKGTLEKDFFCPIFKKEIILKKENNKIFFVYRIKKKEKLGQ